MAYENSSYIYTHCRKLLHLVGFNVCVTDYESGAFDLLVINAISNLRWALLLEAVDSTYLYFK